MIDFLLTLPRLVALRLIRFYQKTLSLDHGWWRRFFPYGYCKYYPTCSQYGYEAIAKHGLIKGGLKTIKRLLRCHPWSQGGYDPVN